MAAWLSKHWIRLAWVVTVTTSMVLAYGSMIPVWIFHTLLIAMHVWIFSKIGIAIYNRKKRR